MKNFDRFIGRLKPVRWENCFVILFLIVSPFLVFYNLDLNPRSWHDEGSYLTLAKTLAEDGVYAVRNASGYQSFGAVQSLGPTVVLPIAWFFRAFGASLINGRIVEGIYLLSTLFLFFLAAHILFGRRSALFSVVLLLASPAAGFLMYGRPVLGEAPALGFFLAGWLVWTISLGRNKIWLSVLSGLLIGAAILTKSQYLLISFATLGLMILLDLFYYRLGGYKSLLIIAICAACCVAGWYGWQISYFGEATFRENASKLGGLASVTMGFNLHSFVDALRFLFGSGSGYLYFFWGFPALVYLAIASKNRTRESFLLAFLVLFTSLWLAYFTFVNIPWSRYIFPAAAIIAIFVGKLFSDLLAGFLDSFPEFWEDAKRFLAGKMDPSAIRIRGLGTVLALATITLWSGYQLQKVVRDQVLDRYGAENVSVYSPPGLSYPEEMARYLTESVSRDAVIDTWERELGILTDNIFHYPDPSLLAEAHAHIYRGDPASPSGGILGEEYFNSVRPDYVVVGWYSRFNNLYDPSYLSRNAALMVSIGDSVWGYELYKLNNP